MTATPSLDTVASGIPPYATVLFDLDGTLTDPLDGIANALAYALDRLGRPPVDRATVARLIGPPYTDGYVNVLGMTPAEAEETIAVYREYFSERGLFENTVYDGIPALLQQLSDAGVRCGLATSKPETFAERIVEHFGLRLDVVAGATLDGVRSRKGDVIAEAVRRLGGGDPARVDTTRMVMVGDRSHDVVGATEHGLPCIGVLWGYGDADELFGAGAAAVVATPADLTKLLLPAA
ncbi:MAG: phosphoglycolate phosphatase [Frankiaceae bacterium]|nr:phosphoglycolate phosphatase [Frankiaceae bacterium]